MRLWFEGGAGGSGDEAGDPAAAGAVTSAEDSSGVDETAADEGGSDAKADRDAYIAGIVQRGIEAGVSAALARINPAPGTTAAPPPTASRGVVADLEREALAIAAEEKRINDALETQGATAKNLVDQNRLAMRFSNFNARLLAHGMQVQDQERQVDGAARGDDKAKEAAWKKFANAPENAGVPVRFLRPTFEQEYAQANPQPQPAKPKPASREPVVDVSGGGGGGGSAGMVKPRIVTQATYNNELEAAEDRGDIDTVVKMGRDRRDGRLKVQG